MSWTLAAGDFLARIDPEQVAVPPAPGLIFYDPFSGNSDGRLWTPDAFYRLRAVCAGRSVEMFTYSASTAVRAALLAAGFYVARGSGVGDRAETTVALTPEASHGRYELLGADWLARWDRSAAKIPAGVHESGRAAFAAAVLGHAQFRGPEAG